MNDSITAAIAIVDELPVLSRTWTFYDSPDVGTPANRAQWIAAASRCWR